MTKGPWEVYSGAVFDGRGVCILKADRNEPLTYPVERDENIRAAGALPDLIAAAQNALICMAHQCGRGCPLYCASGPSPADALTNALQKAGVLP